jgi:hypothetical protein
MTDKDTAIGLAIIIGFLAWATLGIAMGSAMLLFCYGIVVLVFRHAFGVELPNPFNWFS